MTDTPSNTTDDNKKAAPRFNLRGQYIKDLSMENPHAPQSLMGQKEAPKVDMHLDMKARKVQETLYELTMNFNIQTKSQDSVLFIMDLKYAGVFELVNIPQDAIDRVLVVDSAFTLFPFARRVVSDITRDSGFPSLVLEPIDFLGIYHRRQQQEAQAAGGTQGMKAPENALLN